MPASAKGKDKVANPADPGILNYKHHYSNEARMLANSDIPKRSLAIAKEVCFFY